MTTVARLDRTQRNSTETQENAATKVGVADVFDAAAAFAATKTNAATLRTSVDGVAARTSVERGRF